MARVVGLPDLLAAAVGAIGDERTLVAGTGEHRVATFLEITQADWEATVAGIRTAFMTWDRRMSSRLRPGRRRRQG